MPFLVSVDSEIEEQWTRMCRVLAEGCRQAVQMAVDEGVREAKTVHKYRDRTGNLTRSIRGVLDTYDRLGARGTIVAGAEYASFVENGTRPHEIWPKAGHGEIGPLRAGQSRRAKNDIGTARVALRWYASDGVHFARMVHHPGTIPFPFMGPALHKAERVLEREIGVYVVRAQESIL